MNEKIKMENELYHFGIKGMRWGVRRYQNPDGSLTNAGQKRYERDQRENSGKKKGNKVGNSDPNRWVKEDLSRSRTLANETLGLVNKLKTANDTAIRKQPKSRMDLSSMTDKEMRDRINREILERQYNDMFTPQKTSRGREYVNKVLDNAGDALAVTSSVLGIALIIKELRG